MRILKVLAIGSHPDDVELGCGGALLVHGGAGDEVHEILCTLGGVRGNPKDREAEALRAASILGAKIKVLDYPVRLLNRPSQDFTKVLQELIEDIRPDRIYVHCPMDYHQVHVTVALSTISAAPTVPQILLYETISSTTLDFKPNAFVEITKFIEPKIKSVEAHASQMIDRFYLQPNVIRSLANTRYVWGKLGENPGGLAEGFMIKKFII